MSLIGVLILASPLLAFAQDSDSDLMPDAYELAHPCLNVSIPDGGVDYDADAMTSLQEYQYSPLLNTCLADTDGDGVGNGIKSKMEPEPLNIPTLTSKSKKSIV